MRHVSMPQNRFPQLHLYPFSAFHRNAIKEDAGWGGGPVWFNYLKCDPTRYIQQSRSNIEGIQLRAGQFLSRSETKRRQYYGHDERNFTTSLGFNPLCSGTEIGSLRLRSVHYRSFARGLLLVVRMRASLRGCKITVDKRLSDEASCFY